MADPDLNCACDSDHRELVLDRVRISVETGCWLWRGRPDNGGYGRFRHLHAQTIRAHRFSYIAFVGAIPAGLVLDHLCRVRTCVNPEHLEPVTAGENTRRAFLTPGVVPTDYPLHRCGHTTRRRNQNWRGTWCPECKKEKYSRGLPPGDPRHGLPTGYANHGCKCALCSARRRADKRDRAARRPVA